MQCRFSEMLVLFAFFKPDLTIGLTIGCFLSNMTGFLAGQGFWHRGNLDCLSA